MTPYDLFVKRYGRLPTEIDPAYLELLRMSKYRILDTPDLKPGKCANCGASKNDGRKYVDFGLEVDFYGIVYICGLCVTDVASQMGLFNDLRREVAFLQDRLLKIKKQENRGVELRDNFLQIFKEVQDYIASLPAISNDSSSNSSTVVDEFKEPENQRTIDSNEQPIERAKSGTDESVPSSGSKDLSSLTKLLST